MFSYQLNPQEVNNEFALLNKVGTVKAFAGSTPPDGWLFCDGAQISRTTYAALFAVIGTTYGAGDGSTTFNLPVLFTVGSRVIGSVFGNGKTMGFYNGTSTVGLCALNSYGGNWTFMPRYDAYNTGQGTYYGGVLTNQTNSTYQLTPDGNASGISTDMYAQNFEQKSRCIIKY